MKVKKVKVRVQRDRVIITSHVPAGRGGMVRYGMVETTRDGLRATLADPATIQTLGLAVRAG